MIVTPIPVHLELPPSLSPRSEGIHVSSLIRCIATETGILKPEWAEEVSLSDVRTITDPIAVLRISIGLAWEQFYIGQILEKEGIIDHPGEMECDGVYLTHDAESLSVIITGGKKIHAVVIHEIKATYKSTKTVGDLRDQWMWMAQVKSYCKAAGTRFAQMHVLFLCGDYTYPIKPILCRWSIEFSEEEIEENWTLLTDYRDHRLALETDGI
jgi:hypothetical protein